MTWRHKARPIIAEIIRRNSDLNEPQLKRLIRDAYPWGQRCNHPYKIWCDEVKKQLFAWRAGMCGHVDMPLFQKQEGE